VGGWGEARGEEKEGRRKKEFVATIPQPEKEQLDLGRTPAVSAKKTMKKKARWTEKGRGKGGFSGKNRLSCKTPLQGHVANHRNGVIENLGGGGKQLGRDGGSGLLEAWPEQPKKRGPSGTEEILTKDRYNSRMRKRGTIRGRKEGERLVRDTKQDRKAISHKRGTKEAYKVSSRERKHCGL